MNLLALRLFIITVLTGGKANCSGISTMQYGSRTFIRQRLELAFNAIEETLENEQIKQMDLGAFL